MLKKNERMKAFNLMLKPATIEIIKSQSRRKGGDRQPYRWFIEEAIACYLKKNKIEIKPKKEETGIKL